MLNPMVAEFMDQLEKMEARGDHSSLEDAVMALARLLENVGDDVSGRHVAELTRIGAIMWGALVREFSREGISENADQANSRQAAQRPAQRRPAMAAPFRGCNCNRTTTQACCRN